MSVRLMTWAWEQTTATASQRLVLLALADHAGEDGVCWPATAALAGKTRLSDRQVRRCIDELVARGLVVRLERRRRADGTLGSCVFRLGPVDQRPPVTAGPPVTHDRTTGHPRPHHRSPTTAPAVIAVTAQEPSENHQGTNTPSLVAAQPTGDGLVDVTVDGASARTRTPPTRARPATGDLDVEFAAWWARYPRRVGRAEARRRWAEARRSTTAAALDEALDAHVRQWTLERRPSDKVPHAATWLHQRRWEDDLTPTAPRPVTSTHTGPRTVPCPECGGPYVVGRYADHACTPVGVG